MSTLIATLNVKSLPDRTLLQGFYYSPRVRIGSRTFGGQWILQQADTVGVKLEHQVFWPFSADGKTHGAATILYNAGHGNGNFYARRSALGNLWLWTAWRGRVGRTRLRPGVFELGDRDCYVVPAFTKSAAQSPIPAQPWDLVIRTASDRDETYTWRKERDVTAGRDKVIGRITVPKRGPGPHQGAAANRTQLSVLNGKTNEQQIVRTYGWDGRLRSELDVSDIDLPNTSSDEPEGLGWMNGHLLIAKRTGSAAKRQLGIWQL